MDVPLTLEDQSGGMKSGHADGGKAVRASRVLVAPPFAHRRKLRCRGFEIAALVREEAHQGFFNFSANRLRIALPASLQYVLAFLACPRCQRR